MKIKTALEHSDECSGTWIMSDGTKCHWTEGRSSSIVCVLPDATVLAIPVSDLEYSKEDYPGHEELINLIIQSSEEGPDPEEVRAMTTEEEAEFETARDC